MKKIFAIVTAIALAFILCVSTFATMDAMYADNNVLLWNGTAPDSGLAGKAKVKIDPGQKLFILGWAMKDGTTLKNIYWTVDGTNKEAANVYRDRPDVAGHLGIAAEYGTHGGYGLDDGMMELLGADSLAQGKYAATICALFNDDSVDVIKEFELVVGDEDVAPAQKNDFPKTLEVELNSDVASHVDVEYGDDGSAICETTDESDPWVSFILEEIDTSIYLSVTVTYEVEGNMALNNVYLKDTVKNPGYSGEVGSWSPSGMDGKTEVTYVFADDFALMDGVKLTGIRFPGAKEVGSKLTIKSIVFNNPNGVDPQPQIDARDFSKDSGDALSYDQILVNGNAIANGNDDVIATKKGIDGTDGSIETIGLYGWFGNGNVETDAIGYSINGGEIVYGDFFVETGTDVTGLNANNRRFMVEIDVSGLTGANEIWLYARLVDGQVIKLNRFESGKDREIYVIFNGPAAANPGSGDATMVVFVLAAVALALVVLKKKVF